MPPTGADNATGAHSLPHCCVIAVVQAIDGPALAGWHCQREARLARGARGSTRCWPAARLGTGCIASTCAHDYEARRHGPASSPGFASSPARQLSRSLRSGGWGLQRDAGSCRATQGNAGPAQGRPTRNSAEQGVGRNRTLRPADEPVSGGRSASALHSASLVGSVNARNARALQFVCGVLAYYCMLLIGPLSLGAGGVGGQRPTTGALGRTAALQDLPHCRSLAMLRSAST